MDKLICRMCLSNGVPLRDIVNTHIQDTYEALTKITLVTEDSRPTQACYICYAMLCNSYSLKMSCQSSEERLNRVLSSAALSSEHLKPSTKKLEMTQISYITCSEACENMETYIKEEVFNNTEIKQELIHEDIEETEMYPLEHHNIKLEENNDINDMTDASSELMKYKQEMTIEEEIIQHGNSKNMEPKRRYKKKNSEDAKPKKKSQENTIFILKKYNMADSLNNSPDKRYTCDICNKRYVNKSNLMDHQVTHTGELPFQCDECKKRFHCKTNLRAHILIHIGKKSFKCEVCEKTFLRPSNLKRHKQVHLEYRDSTYQCDVCNKGFHMKHLLSKHQLSHGARPFKCNVCNKGFNLGSTLNRHMRLHTGEKPYQCDVCKKTFRSSCNLLLHSRTHTGEKPYKCNLCTKCFSSKSALNVHIKRHNGVRPFSCNICHRGFTERKDLRKHIITHSKVKPSECVVCKK